MAARLFALIFAASAVRRVAAQTAVSVSVYSPRTSNEPLCSSLDNIVFAGSAEVGSCFGAGDYRDR